ncbi:MAG: hypothetical protein ABSC05_34155 [Candidatus Solibacter sp.]|jgi:hypothetical protein
MKGPISVAIGSLGAYALVAKDNDGNSSGVKCGWPKLSLSSDGAHWSTCSLNATASDDRACNPVAAYAGDDRLYIGYLSVGINEDRRLARGRNRRGEGCGP